MRIHYTHLWLADDDVTEHGDDDKRVGRDLEKKRHHMAHIFKWTFVQPSFFPILPQTFEWLKIDTYYTHQIESVANEWVHLADGVAEDPRTSKTRPDGEPFFRSNSAVKARIWMYDLMLLISLTDKLLNWIYDSN